jgi:hypothetical protein
MTWNDITFPIPGLEASRMAGDSIGSGCWLDVPIDNRATAKASLMTLVNRAILPELFPNGSPASSATRIILGMFMETAERDFCSRLPHSQG